YSAILVTANVGNAVSNAVQGWWIGLDWVRFLCYNGSR
ncbi:MAG: hypothetical protein ACI90Y_002465, partial [Polaromonas sp.]